MSFEAEKSYLNQYQRIQNRIKQLEEDIKIYLAGSNSLGGGSFIGVKVDHTRSLEAPFERFLAKAHDAEMRLKKYIEETKPILEEIVNTIMAIESIDSKKVLMYHYVFGKSWNEIMSEIDISKTTLMRLHREGLSKLNIKH